MYLAIETFLLHEIAEERRDLNGEDTMQRCAPEQSMTIVGHIGHLIGTQTVILCNGIEFMALSVGNDQS